MLNSENLVPNLTVRPEIDVGIFPAGGLDLIQLDLLQSTLPGGRLLGLGSIGREPGDEFLELLDLFFLLFVGFLHLLDQELAGLIPEVIVTSVQLDLAVVDIGSMSTHLI